MRSAQKGMRAPGNRDSMKIPFARGGGVRSVMTAYCIEAYPFKMGVAGRSGFSMA